MFMKGRLRHPTLAALPPWDDVDELELTTLSWVHWFNEERLHGHCGDVPPAEFESAFSAAQPTAPNRGRNPGQARASNEPREAC